MLYTIVPMDQIFPVEPRPGSGSPDRQSGSPGGPAARPGGQGGIAPVSRAFCGTGLGTQAALGGAMARLDYQTAAGKVLPC